MDEHWQVIEDALKYWRSGLDLDEERMHIDAALAFVREQRTPPTVPLEVWSAMNELYSVNPYHSAWRVILDWLTLTQMDAQDKEMTKE